MLSIIIVNYRQKDYLTKCVHSIEKNLKHPHEIIIVNNSAEDLNHLKDQANILPSANLGYSHANNLGVKHSKGEYILFLNADTEVRNDFMEKFLNEFKEVNFGAVGLRLINDDGTFQLSFWKENTFKNEKYNKKSEKLFKERDKAFISEIEKQYSDISEVDWVSGAAMIVKKSVFEDAGGFDEDFFLFYEDADLCKRLKNKGFPIYFFPYSDILHHKGENVNKEFSSKTYFYSKQSQLLYYKKHNSAPDRMLLRTYLILKFGFLYITSLKKINLQILLLSLGLKDNI